MASKKNTSASKHVRCSVEGPGWPAVTVEIEHVGSDKPSKKAKPSKDKGRRRKLPPKTIEFEVESFTNEAIRPIHDSAEQDGGLQSEDQRIEVMDSILSGGQDDVNNKTYDQEEENLNEVSEKSNRKTPNYYLRQWHALHSESYCQAAYDRESPPAHSRSMVTLLVVWNGAYWTDVSLADLGLVLSLGHRGAACELSETTLTILVGALDGYTSIRVRYCKHESAPSRSLQLLAAGIFPCSESRPKSGFTMHMLDGYDAFTTVGRTSGHKINSVMVRSTKPGFPDVVDDRYRELMNTYRKWLYITKLRRSGHLFELHPKLDVHPGDQAFDCVACPRPEFNFSWTEVAEDEWVWFRAYYSYDGNFRAYRKNKKVDAGDVCFSDGLAYFPPKQEYEEWVKSQPEPKKSQRAKTTQSNTQAGILQALAHLPVQVIAAWLHEEWSTFSRGKGKQIYCDFAFGSMYKYLSARGELPIGMTYDIWCHWWTNFWRRMANLPPIYHIPEHLDITGAIPKWHLLGHHRLCWILYSLDHKQFVGRLEGEGPERVWAHFNEHSGSTSEQGPGMRLDTWCNVACDWSFVKATEMHRTLPSRFREARKSYIEQLREHETLTSSFPRRKIREWESESIEPKDENNDGNWTTPLMDPVLKGGYYETLREERETETEAVRLTGRRTGAVRWIADGIELEHSLQNLKDERKALGSKPTARQAELLNSKRLALRDRIDIFMQKRVLHMLEIDEPDQPRPLQFVGEDGEWAEPVELGLPSSYKADTLLKAGVSKLAEIERRLRRGACTDALESVKRLLGGKAAVIKFKNQHLTGQIATTRAESTIQKHTVKILKARQRYLNSRDALLMLEPTETDLDQYRDLQTQDLQTLKTYFEEYAQTTGHGKTSMSWIWRSAAAPNKEDWEVDSKIGTSIPLASISNELCSFKNGVVPIKGAV
ncbi:hypothetical protein RhiJN_05433 [Ceratobasidium sp. AG-Ba]|nr:hypothetical protein RhiJN_05433 [Ceratobasidium sp. AG-Ba]